MPANDWRNFNINDITEIPFYLQGQAIVEWHYQILNWQKKKRMNYPYIICLTRGSPKFPQTGREVANSPNDIYTISMAKTLPEPSLGSLSYCRYPISRSHLLERNDKYPELSFNVHSFLCTRECVTAGHLFFFSHIVLCFKYIGNELPVTRLPAVLTQVAEVTLNLVSLRSSSQLASLPGQL